jgi:hypothetical protein
VQRVAALSTSLMGFNREGVSCSIQCSACKKYLMKCGRGEESLMFAKIIKAVAAVGLLTALVWRSPNYAALLSFFVCMAALVVVGQAIQSRNAIWIVIFLAVGALFNPVFPVAMSRNVYLITDIICATLFASSLALLKTMPRMSILSITDRTPGSESL